MKKIVTILGAAIALSAIAIGFAYSGLYDVRAISPHSGIVGWYLSTTARASVKRQSRDVNVPDLGDEALVLAGINDYESMCVDCHGAPGKKPAPIAQGLNPPAPELAQSAQSMSAAELFWVTKHGIRMTGMPAWGASHGDDALWPVVAFTTRLPDLDESSYEALLATAAGHGHHAADPSSTEGENTETRNPSAGQAHLHDDGSTHVHKTKETTQEPQQDEHDDHEH